jgi:tetratricopeptide (TPR) repeat protein
MRIRKRKAFEINPNNKYALVAKGTGLHWLGNDTEALENFDEALALDPNFIYALNGKGWTYYNLGYDNPDNYTYAEAIMKNHIIYFNIRISLFYYIMKTVNRE